MNATADVEFDVSESNKKGLSRLITVSHNRPMNFADALDWDTGVDRRLCPKVPEHGWLYGTDLYEQLTKEQRIECLWMEIARDVSMFISLEQTIPVLYMGYVNKYQGQLSKDINEYLMIFSKEEIVHTMVFKRYLKEANLPLYVGEGSAQILLGELPNLNPALGIMYTLIIEWIAELGAMESTQDANLEPMTRALFKNHHRDEARHISFGKWISEQYIAQCDEAQLQQIKGMVAGLVKRMIPAYTFTPEIADYVSFDYPVDKNNSAVFTQIYQSESNKTLNQKRFKQVFNWLEGLNLL